MAPPTLYVAVTNHGFGHATRAAAVAATIQAQLPQVRLILATTAPQCCCSPNLEGPFLHRPRAFDVGVLQQDSLTMDKTATLEQLRRIQRMPTHLVAEEAAFLQQERVSLVLADIPPLATRVAEAAGVPCWMMSNFGWDFIYRPWGGGFVAVADWIAECFQRCDRMFRLPFHEPMKAFPTITDVGLTGGSPRYAPDQLRAILAPRVPSPELLSKAKHTVLLTFGGLGLQQIPYQGLSRFPDWQFISFDAQAPELPNLLKITDRCLRPVDVMPLCDRIVSKPGYSTFAEACRLNIPILTLTRQDFAESALLVEGIQAVSHHRILRPTDLLQGTWDFLAQPLLPPRQAMARATDGNQTIAAAVVDYLSTAASQID
ncbi:hypothetical protein XM38_024290 [Halomicronema hongdechloris C2206]|uniref:Glycosyl transferase n=2 Tax=Halomicronema hongdechloris TaxID=1209493 RepID=A0A1Z3HMV3_9CYAN|nr:hypothetical protein XM38_024290 [Halomicronema hongdechloris C2206]